MNTMGILYSHPLIQPTLTLASFLVLALLIRFIFGKKLKSLASLSKTKYDDKIIDILKVPAFWSVLLVGVYFTAIQLPYFADPDLKPILIRGLLTLGLLVLADTGMRSIDSLLNTINFLKTMLKSGLLAILGLVVLWVWDVNITLLLTSAGFLGVGIAFAAKDTIANVFGGVSILTDKPYKIGDYVLVEEYRGQVVEIGMRSTKLLTRDNMLLTVPNSIMTTKAVINETGLNPRYRIRIKIGVAYGSDLNKVENILLDVFRNSDYIVEEPEPVVRYRNFGDSAIELEALGSIAEPALRGQASHEIIKNIYSAFKENDITIPFPQRDVHMYSA